MARLAIYTPAVGRLSETFIRRYIEGLEGVSGLIYERVDTPDGTHDWKLPGAVLGLEGWRNRNRFARRVARRIGYDWEAIAIRRFLRRNRIEALMAQFLGSSLPIQRAVRGTGVRFFVHLHGHDASARLRDPRYRRAYLQYAEPECAAVISNNTYFRRHLSELGIPEEKIRVIPYGIEIPERVEPGPKSDRGSAGRIRCLAVGRMVSKKAPILLLEAFRRAAENVPDLELTYIGGGVLYPAAVQFVEAFGLGQKVHLAGGCSHAEVQARFRSADLFLQHSRIDPATGDAEGLPLAILEAMANGLPVVSTRHSGIPEAVLEGETGLLSEEGDVGAMAENLIRLATRPEERLSFGRAGRRRAETHYDWQVEKRALETLLLGANV